MKKGKFPEKIQNGGGRMVSVSPGNAEGWELDEVKVENNGIRFKNRKVAKS